MSKEDRPRRVFLSTQTQQPITQYVTHNPDTEAQKKGERACVVDMDKRTGQFTLRAKAPHYEAQLEALEKLVKLGRLVEVPPDKESKMVLMLQNGELVKPGSDRDKKEAVIELQRQLAEKSDEINGKDARIKELEEMLKGNSKK